MILIFIDIWTLQHIDTNEEKLIDESNLPLLLSKIKHLSSTNCKALIYGFEKQKMELNTLCS